MPLAITAYGPEVRKGGATFELDCDSKTVLNIEEISIHSFKPGYEQFRREMIAAVKANGSIVEEILMSKNIGGAASYSIGAQKWFIEFTGVIGHTSTNSSATRVSDILLPDATILYISKRDKSICTSDLVGAKHSFAWGSETETESESKRSFAKSRVCRAALSIYRYGTGIGQPHLKTIPKLPWDRILDDASIITYLGISEEAQQYLTTLPEYYEEK